MSKNDKRPTAEIINPGLGDIEKVRDILFGRYVERFERQFDGLESRLEADLDKLKNNLNEQNSNLNIFIKESLAKINQKIDQEKTSRLAEFNELQNSFVKAEATLQHSISLMEDQVNQDFNAIQVSIKESHQQILDNSIALQSQLTTQMEQQKRETEDDNVSSQALAMLLDEVAIKLRKN